MRPTLLLVAALLLGGCTSLRIKFNSPVGDELQLTRRGDTVAIPSLETIPTGKHPVELRISAAHARKLGFKEEFSLYGYLVVGAPTENSELTNVVLDVPDDLIRAARREGKVLETIVYDDGQGGAILVSLKLGQIQP